MFPYQIEAGNFFWSMSLLPRKSRSFQVVHPLFMHGVITGEVPDMSTSGVGAFESSLHLLRVLLREEALLIPCKSQQHTGMLTPLGSMFFEFLETRIIHFRILKSFTRSFPQQIRVRSDELGSGLVV